MMKRVLAVLLTVCLMATLAPFAVSAVSLPVAEMSSAIAEHGETVILTVTLEGAPENFALAFDLDLPQGITLVEGKNTRWLINKSNAVSDINFENLQGVLLVATSEMIDVNGEILSFEFAVGDTAILGDNEIRFEIYTDTTDDKVSNVAENVGVITVCNHNYIQIIGSETHYYECELCGSLKDVEEHAFDDDCDETCNGCGCVRIAPHNFGDEFTSNSEEHWYKCADCDAKTDVEKHTFDDACDETCNGCGYVRIAPHNFGDEFTNNSEEHWHKCADCDAKTDVEKHAFDDACDETCDACGYVREVEHSFGDEWISDDDYHWQICAVCGHESEKEEHNVEDGFCTDCGMEFFVSGDVDGVDGVDASDAIYLLYNVFFGAERYPVNQGCDYDGNGEVEAADAIYLLYHVFFGAERYPLN